MKGLFVKTMFRFLGPRRTIRIIGRWGWIESVEMYEVPD